MSPRKRKDPQGSLPLALPGTPTVQALIGHYENDVVPLHRQTSRPSELACLHWWAEVLPKQPTSSDVLGALQKRIESAQGFAETTANRYLVMLSAVYRYGTQRYPLAVVRSPLLGVPRFRPAQKRPKALRDPETTWPVLLAAMPDAMARSLLCVLRWQGLRIGEALGLQLDHVDLQRGRLLIVQQRRPDYPAPSPLKGSGSAADMPLHPQAAAALRARIAELRLLGAPRDAWLHPYRQRCRVCRAGRCCTGTCLQHLMGILRRLSPGDFPRRARASGGHGWHVFRHTLGADIDRSGLPDRDAMLLLRHANVGITTSYFGRTRERTIEPASAAKAWGLQPATSTSAPIGTRGRSTNGAKGRRK